MHVRNTVSGPLQKKKTSKITKEQTKAKLLKHKHMTCGSKVISQKFGSRKKGRDYLNHRLTDSVCSHFRAHGT